MSVFNRKSKEELEVETQMNIKLLKKKAEDYAGKCDSMAQKYDAQKEAARSIGNKSLEQAFEEKAKNLRVQASKIRSFVLIVDDIGMMKDQSALMNSFADTMKTYVKTIGKGQANAQWMSQMESQLDRAVDESERVGDLFGGLLQDVGFNLNFELDSIGGEKSNNRNANDKEKVEDINVDEMEKRLREKLKDLDKVDTNE
ncbi:hypothetical protein [Cuniculiplasma divulgatum]|uniref:Uncharacterized protein n=1 Tax=Cuniculiplasma divulgatum TaxID=1673428 RepID=A0A1R4A714_9ARCH|nr:hypothetical protein [Cuniculiplasma divulgatum]EQB69935.1 MAG: hypothetical protein AMDU5_GPLC00001G0153 [Thermoplasmatales archaeon Gpl]MCI2411865.1 hypothetical protein [Cuniculiplasma sp.]WMT49053.1 MAG: hypothetical protein RE472_08260 [Thermoplasmatales archaeon]SJK84771.1 hypothetical protein CPM_0929 [Cuniculiplasma divulgatum]